jgi:hypothetical protein
LAFVIAAARRFAPKPTSATFAALNAGKNNHLPEEKQHV